MMLYMIFCQFCCIPSFLPTFSFFLFGTIQSKTSHPRFHEFVDMLHLLIYSWLVTSMIRLLTKFTEKAAIYLFSKLSSKSFETRRYCILLNALSGSLVGVGFVYYMCGRSHTIFVLANSFCFFIITMFVVKKRFAKGIIWLLSIALMLIHEAFVVNNKSAWIMGSLQEKMLRESKLPLRFSILYTFR